MMRRLLCVIVVVLFVAQSAYAQNPYNLAAPVTDLATLFENLYGPRGLIVDSEATLPGEQSHSAHFNNDFQTNFGKTCVMAFGLWRIHQGLRWLSF